MRETYNQTMARVRIIAAVVCMLLAWGFVIAPAAAQTTGDPLDRRAQLPWWERAPERKIGHYWIKTDVDPELANRLARHLNLMYAEYSRRLASLPSREPEKLNVMIFRTQRDYMFVLRTKFGVDGSGSGGMFFANPSGTALAFFIEGLPMRRIEHVLQHEGFHQFAHSRFGGDLPPWTNEGLAEFFGEAVLVDRKLVIGQTTPRVIDRIKNAIELNEYIPFRRMLTMDGRDWNQALRGGNASLQYNQAWSMVHFLVYGDNGRYVNAFEQYLRLINAGYRSEESFIRAFGNDIQAFEQRWVEYARQAKPSAFVTAMERMEFLAAGALHLREKGIIPESLAELKAKLQEAGFEYTQVTHGMETKLSAADDALFEIPVDDLADEQPVFVVEKIDPRKLPLRERRREQEHPSPCALSTQHLEPNDLVVRWHLDEDDEAFSYEIIVR